VNLGDKSITCANVGISVPVRDYFRVAVILAAALIVVFARELWWGMNLFVIFFHDPIPFYFFYPSEIFTARQWSSGFFPIWDHLRGLGAPNVIPTFFVITYPLRIILHLFPIDTALSFFTIVRLWTAGMGMYFAGKCFGLGRSGSMCASLSFMLCGYFMGFLSFQDMNAYAFFPWVLGMWRRWISRRTMASAATCVFLLACSFASHPEAVFNGTGTLLFWGLLMVQMKEIPGRKKAAWMFLWILLFFWAGLAWLIIFFPFIEFWANGWDYHLFDFGRIHYDVKTFAALIHPFFNNILMAFVKTKDLPYTVPWTASYIGLVPSLFAITALLRFRRIPREIAPAAVILFVTLGVVYGLPLFIELTRLPVVNFSYNYRYLQPIAAFAAAFLAGAGMKEILDAPDRGACNTAALVTTILTAVVLVSGVVGLAIAPLPEYIRRFPYLTVSTLIIALLTVLILLAYARRRISKRNSAIALSVMLFLCLLTSRFFAGPAGRRIRSIPNYIKTILVSEWEGSGRIYGTNKQILHPNLAELFNLKDLRDQAALLPGRYMRLITNLNEISEELDIVNKFPSEGYYLSLDLNKVAPSWFDLLGVDRLLSWSFPGAVELWPSFDRSWKTQLTHKGFADVFAVKIDGVGRNSMVFISPGMLEKEIEIPADSEHFILALSTPRHSTCHNLWIKEGGERKPAYSRCFVPGVTGWREVKLDLSEYAGKKVEIAISSVPYIPHKGAPALVAWGDGFFTVKDRDPSIELVRHSNFRVYRNTDALPLAFVMKEKPPTESSANANLIKAKVRGGVAEVVQNESQKMAVNVAPTDNDWLVISRVYYPGWKAFVTDSNGNSKECQIRPCLTAFSTVPLNHTDRKVELLYHPACFRIGLWSWIAYMALFISGVCASTLIRIQSKRDAAG